MASPREILERLRREQGPLPAPMPPRRAALVGQPGPVGQMPRIGSQNLSTLTPSQVPTPRSPSETPTHTNRAVMGMGSVAYPYRIAAQPPIAMMANRDVPAIPAEMAALELPRDANATLSAQHIENGIAKAPQIAAAARPPLSQDADIRHPLSVEAAPRILTSELRPRQIEIPKESQQRAQQALAGWAPDPELTPEMNLAVRTTLERVSRGEVAGRVLAPPSQAEFTTEWRQELERRAQGDPVARTVAGSLGFTPGQVLESLLAIPLGLSRLAGGGALRWAPGLYARTGLPGTEPLGQWSMALRQIPMRSVSEEGIGALREPAWWTGLAAEIAGWWLGPQQVIGQLGRLVGAKPVPPLKELHAIRKGAGEWAAIKAILKGVPQRALPYAGTIGLRDALEKGQDPNASATDVLLAFGRGATAGAILSGTIDLAHYPVARIRFSAPVQKLVDRLAARSARRAEARVAGWASSPAAAKAEIGFALDSPEAFLRAIREAAGRKDHRLVNALWAQFEKQYPGWQRPAAPHPRTGASKREIMDAVRAARQSPTMENLRRAARIMGVPEEQVRPSAAGFGLYGGLPVPSKRDFLTMAEGLGIGLDAAKKIWGLLPKHGGDVLKAAAAAGLSQELAQALQKAVAAPAAPTVPEAPAAPEAAPAAPRDLLGEEVRAKELQKPLWGERGVPAVWRTIGGVEYIISADQKHAQRADGTGKLIPLEPRDTLQGRLEADAAEAKPPAKPPVEAEKPAVPPKAEVPAEPPPAPEKPDVKTERIRSIVGRMERRQLAQAAKVAGIHRYPDVAKVLKAAMSEQRHLWEIMVGMREEGVDRILEEAGEGKVEAPLLDWLSRTKIAAYEPKGEMYHEIRKALEGRPYARQFFALRPGQPGVRGIDQVLESAQRERGASGLRGDIETLSDFLDEIVRQADAKFEARGRLTPGQRAAKAAGLVAERYGPEAAEKLQALGEQYDETVGALAEATQAARETIERHLIRAPGRPEELETKLEAAIQAKERAEAWAAELQAVADSLKMPAERLKRRAQAARARIVRAHAGEVAPGQFRLTGGPEGVAGPSGHLIEVSKGFRTPWEEGPPMATKAQKARAHAIARQKGWLVQDKKGRWKPTSNYRRFARIFTGRSSMKEMTKAQASEFIKALEGLVMPRGGRAARLPTRMAIVPKAIADRFSPAMKDIGLLETFRPGHRVFEKLGLQDEWWDAFKAGVRREESLAAFRKEALEVRNRLDAKNDYSTAKLWHALNGTLPEGQTLSGPELAAAAWGRKVLDRWADDLNLPAEMRRRNYIYHIFEAETQAYLKEKHPFPPELVQVFDDYVPGKSVFAPFMKERIGRTAGLKIDFWTAIDAYLATATRKYHFDPVIQRLRVYHNYLPPNARRYLRRYIERLTGREAPTDRLINETLRNDVAPLLEAVGLGRIADWLRQGNPAAKIAYGWAGAHYTAWLGLYPLSVVKNLFQQTLTVAECGIAHWVKARALRGTAQGRILLRKSEVLRSRAVAYLPSLDEEYVRTMTGRGGRALRWVQEKAMWAFRRADRDNVENAFLAGYLEAKGLGLPEPWCLRRGDEVAKNTQYIYTKLGSSELGQSAAGRVLGMLTTWPINFAELLGSWMRGNPSKLYAAYEKETGRKVQPEAWVGRHKQALRYAALLALFAVVGALTGIKAIEYTGWGSLETFARAARGELPGIQTSGEVVSLAAALAQGDAANIKKYAKRLRPDRKISLIRSIEDIAAGKRPWMRLFLLTRPEAKAAAERAARKTKGVEAADKRDELVRRALKGSRKAVAELKRLGFTLSQVQLWARTEARRQGVSAAERIKALARLRELWQERQAA